MNVIYDFEKEIEKYGLTTEQYEKCLKDCSDKQNKINELDWAELVGNYNLKIHFDTLRKAQQTIFGGAFVSEYFKNKQSLELSDSNYIKELQIEKDELYKVKKQVSDQRREYNKLLMSDARSDNLMMEIIKSANRLNKINPLDFAEYTNNVSDKEGVLFWSDWHYGMVTDNIWNKYDTEICRNRVVAMVNKAKEYILLNKIKTLHIVLLGDAAHGAIHSSCRVASEEDTCDQIMEVSEIMAQAIGSLSKDTNKVNVYSCYGNHLRTIQDKKDSIHSDNMEKMIPWWLNWRLQNNTKISIIESEFKEFTKLNILGYNICCTHGDLDNIKNIGTVINTLFSKLYGETIDYTVSGDKHHLEEFEQFDIENIIIRSLCGTDEYANNKRLYSKAGQTLMIFNKYDGRESTYNIKLN